MCSKNYLRIFIKIETLCPLLKNLSRKKESISHGAINHSSARNKKYNRSNKIQEENRSKRKMLIEKPEIVLMGYKYLVQIKFLRNLGETFFLDKFRSTGLPGFG